MALECLAILGTKNEPLYLCAPSSGKILADEGDTEGDAFGFLDPAADESGLSTNISIRHEVRLLEKLFDVYSREQCGLPSRIPTPFPFCCSS
jgi:hypothetical protein